MNIDHWAYGMLIGTGLGTIVPALIYDAIPPLTIGILMLIAGFVCSIKAILDGEKEEVNRCV